MTFRFGDGRSSRCLVKQKVDTADGQRINSYSLRFLERIAFDGSSLVVIVTFGSSDGAQARRVIDNERNVTVCVPDIREDAVSSISHCKSQRKPMP